MKKKSDIFQFKQFNIRHDRCAMKVGTDAVLLGAWANIENVKRVLEIGTGSGVIALMLAQRTKNDVIIDAVEIDKEDATQAIENILNSLWPKKVNIHNTPIQNFTSSQTYDLIISNPPFFNNSLLPPSVKRATARHTNSLTFTNFLDHASRLIHERGKLALIIPTKEGEEFKNMAVEEFKFYLIRKLALFSKVGKKQERWLFEFSKTYQQPEESTLTIHENDQWSSHYRNLTQDFYLNF